MRTLAILGLMAVVSGWTAAAQYHDPVYLAGGYNSATSTIYVRGVFKIDVNASTMSTFFTPRYYTYGFKMDADNENVVFATGDQFSTSTLYSGPEAGLYRYDPAAQKFSTLYHDTMTFYRPYKLLINQDGDYVFGSYTRNWTGTRTEYHYRIMKVDRNGALSTVLTTQKIGRRAYFSSTIQTNIDTGNYLVCDHLSLTSPTTIRYPVLDVSDDGIVNTWSTGGTYGWYGYYSAPLDFRTGELTGPYGTRVYRLTPGIDTRTTVGVVSLMTDHSLLQSRFDVQTAASPRWVAVGYKRNPPYMTHVYYIDRISSAVTSILVDPSSHSYHYDFEFYRGRYVQTVKTGFRKWDVLLNMPDQANKAYAMAMTMSGIRPGLQLVDGRTIFINPDILTILTVNHLIPDIFNPGPGVLDGSGKAKGALDVSMIPGPGWPFWIAVAIIDPQAPTGIGFLPDVRVIKF